MLMQACKYPGRMGRAAFTELLRRSSLSLAVLSFTFLGCAFGFESEKNHSKRGSLYALFLALILLSSYFLGKGLRFNSAISALSFALPHCLIWISSFWRLRRIAKGVET
jgi:lipopolysaccharide export system permease protein